MWVIRLACTAYNKYNVYSVKLKEPAETLEESNIESQGFVENCNSFQAIQTLRFLIGHLFHQSPSFIEISDLLSHTYPMRYHDIRKNSFLNRRDKDAA